MAYTDKDLSYSISFYVNDHMSEKIFECFYFIKETKPELILSNENLPDFLTNLVVKSPYHITS